MLGLPFARHEGCNSLSRSFRRAFDPSEGLPMLVKTLLVATVLALGWGGSAARADDQYYMMIFAAQAKPNIAQASHSFGLFAKVSGEGAQQKVETATSSWMSASLQLEALRRDP